jgi:hypothetical protein
MKIKNIKYYFSNFMKYKNAFLTSLLVLLYCADIDGIKNKKEKKERTDLLFLFLAQNRTKGNCARKETSTFTGYCDRRSAGNCNTNDLILTSGEKLYNISDGSELVKAVPSCSFSYISSGITTDVVTSFSNQDYILANNTYSVVSSCESLGLNTSTLISESEYLFTISPRGRIAIAADKIVNTPDSILSLTLPAGTSSTQIKSDAANCLLRGFPQAEKDLVSDLRTLKRVKSITCSTRAGDSNQCSF